MGKRSESLNGKLAEDTATKQ
jgi:hypothetical protein